jgi:hypothetical protein
MNEKIKNIEENLYTNFLHDIGHGIMLSTEEENILKKYDIDYINCTSTKELLFKIEDYLNDSYQELDDLEQLSIRISEHNYYYETNK